MTEASNDSPAGPERISIEEFARLDLRVAKVLEADAVPGTTRLLKIKIDLGSEQRQIVAGIAEKYPPETLVGRSIIVVANLKPARVRGVDSDGMLLAAAPPGGKPILATFEEEIPPGTKVK
jgi:methionyl-tRNA synthetase